MEKSGYIFFYLAAITLIAVIMTIYDKAAAKKSKRRISETALLLTALAGGAAGMYTVMNIIRHKTKHKKFMLTLPVMTVLHLALICFVIFYY